MSITKHIENEHNRFRQNTNKIIIKWTSEICLDYDISLPTMFVIKSYIYISYAYNREEIEKTGSSKCDHRYFEYAPITLVT